MARLELSPEELRRLADQPQAPGVRVAADVHPVAVHELDRLRRCSRAEVVREALGLWIARELQREVRRERVGEARRIRESARAAEERAHRRAQEIIEAL